MPIYEYKCKDCGYVMEFLEKTGNAKKHKCQKCDSTNLQKLLSGFAVGQSKSSSQACESCISGDSCGSACPGGTCPL
ncbi:MAG: zinc ribbon domain-containing protein [Sedimentisphaerales bacterium]|nr:zinc ribbon domain-containing protein [Sedimentisphaerales bacterium]